MTQGEECIVRAIACHRSSRTTDPTVAAVAVKADAAMAAGTTNRTGGRARSSGSTRSATRGDRNLTHAARGDGIAARPGETGATAMASRAANGTVAAAATGTAATSLPTLAAAGARLAYVRNGRGVTADAAHREGITALSALSAIAERLCAANQGGYGSH
jgi:hypothetical protein